MMKVQANRRRRAVTLSRSSMVVGSAIAASWSAALYATVPPPTTQPVTWDNPGTGDYNTVTNWNPDLANPPANADNQFLTVNNGGTAEINANAEGAMLHLGLATGDTGNLVINSGIVTLGELRVGGRDFVPVDQTDWIGMGFTANAGGTGTVVQNGGTVNVTFTHGIHPVTLANYEPPIQSLYIGDSGLTDNNTANGSYTIKNSAILLSGIADNDAIIVGRGPDAIGAFTQQDTSSVTSSGFMIIGNQGATGTYTMSGGTLQVGTGTATANQNLYVADGADNANPTSGTLTQTGGTITVKNDVSIGRRKGTGNYTITGATSSITSGQNFNVGASATGIMTMGTTGGTGPTVTSPNGFSVGISSDPLSPGNGTFTIKSGTLTVGNNNSTITDVIAVGNDITGTGTFNQEGGSVTSTDLLQIGRNNSPNNNLYTMTGGTLQAARFFIGGGSGTGATGGKGTFDLQSGTVTATGTINVGAGSAAGTTVIGALTQSGGSITLSGATDANPVMAVGNGGGATGSYTITNGSLTNTFATTSELSIGRNGALSGTVLINGSGASVTTRNLQIGGGSQGSPTGGNGDLTINSGTLSVTGTTTIVSAAGANTRTLNINGGNVTFATFNNGTAGGTGGLTRTINVTNGIFNVTGVLTGGVNATYNFSGGTTTVNGASALRNDIANPTTVNVSGTAVVTFDNAGTSMTMNASKINLTGGTFNAKSLITNTGTLYISGGTQNIASGAYPGTLTLSSTSTLKTDNTISLASNILTGSSTVNVNTGSLSLTGPLTTSTAQTMTKTGPGTLTISGTQSHVNNSAITNSAGTLNLNSDGGSNLTINANSTTNIGVTQHLKALNVGNGATATLAVNAGTHLVTTAFNPNTSGRLDISNDRMILQFGTNPSPLAATRGWVVNGRGGTDFGNATWQGTGGIASNAAAIGGIGDGTNPGDGISFAIGYVENSFLPSLGLPSYTSFGGQTVDSGSMLIRFTRGADVNLDGRVNTDDVTVVGALYGQSSAEWSYGDFDYDGVVDSDDVTVLGALYDATAPALSQAQLSAQYGGEFAAAFARGQAMAVPEPTSLSLLGLGGIGLLKRRRRR